MRCRRLALARGHSGEPPDREDPGLLLRFVPEFGRSLELVRAGGLFEPFPFLPTFLPAKKVGRSLFHFSPQKFSGQELELVPIGDAAPQALRGLRGGWRSPRRRLRALRARSCGGSAPSRAAKPCAASTGGPAGNIPPGGISTRSRNPYLKFDFDYFDLQIFEVARAGG